MRIATRIPHERELLDALPFGLDIASSRRENKIERIRDQTINQPRRCQDFWEGMTFTDKGDAQGESHHPN